MLHFFYKKLRRNLWPFRYNDARTNQRIRELETYDERNGSHSGGIRGDQKVLQRRQIAGFEDHERAGSLDAELHSCPPPSEGHPRRALPRPGAHHAALDKRSRRLTPSSSSSNVLEGQI